MSQERARQPVFWIATALLGVLFVATAVYGTLAWWMPARRFNEMQERMLAGAPLSREEIREVAHGALRSPLGNTHDACILLAGVGDTSSVPLLIRTLGRWPDTYASCERTCCLKALQRITGENPGNTHRAWKEWAERPSARSPR